MAQQLPESTYTAALEPSASAASLRVGSPIIYLFLGIGTMLAVVILALLMVACSQWRRRHTSVVADDSRKEVRHVYNGGDEVSVTTDVVVFMPGDRRPTYLAAPAAQLHTTTHLSDLSL